MKKRAPAIEFKLSAAAGGAATGGASGVGGVGGAGVAGGAGRNLACVLWARPFGVL